MFFIITVSFVIHQEIERLSAPLSFVRWEGLFFKEILQTARDNEITTSNPLCRLIVTLSRL